MARSNTLLSAAGLCLLLLPAFLWGDLLCHFSPVRPIDNSTNLTQTANFTDTVCTPNELCYTGVGRYGNYSALQAWGCVSEGNCSQVDSLSFQGTVYAMHYDCCDWDYCNSDSDSAQPSRAAAKFGLHSLILAVVVLTLANM